MTDNEIIDYIKRTLKGMGIWSNSYHREALQLGLDLINRQKAEIERLKVENHYIVSSHFMKECEREIKSAKSEAIKEFVNDLMLKLREVPYFTDRYCDMVYRFADKFTGSDETPDETYAINADNERLHQLVDEIEEIIGKGTHDDR